MNLNAWYWRFLENYVYHCPEPPPRKRTKPLEVICVGLPRSGTESIQQALLKLGYDYTYHGWDILFEETSNMPAWVRLGKKRFFPSNPQEDAPIPAEEFDKLVGHAMALADAPASCFASDLIQAYPKAKVVLNMRKDREAWQRSVVVNIDGVNEDWVFWFLHWFDTDMWWIWHVYMRVLWYGMFQCTSTWLKSGVEFKGKRRYDEHVDMVRGMMQRLGREGDLLEWDVGAGWEPLCKFLGKEVPKDENGEVERFPRTNDRQGFDGRIQEILAKQGRRAKRNVVLLTLGLGSVIGGVWWKLWQ